HSGIESRDEVLTLLVMAATAMWWARNSSGVRLANAECGRTGMAQIGSTGKVPCSSKSELEKQVQYICARLNGGTHRAPPVRRVKRRHSRGNRQNGSKVIETGAKL